MTKWRRLRGFYSRRQLTCAIPANCAGRSATYVRPIRARRVSRNVLRKARSLRNGDGTFTSANNVWRYVCTKHGGNACHILLSSRWIFLFVCWIVIRLVVRACVQSRRQVVSLVFVQFSSKDYIPRPNLDKNNTSIKSA